jgi:hypothetical protein
MYHRACWHTRSGVGAGVGEEGSGGLGLDVAHDLGGGAGDGVRPRTSVE